MKRKTTIAAILITLCLTTRVYCAENGQITELIPSGETIGISMELSGLLVLGACEGSQTSPAWEAGIRSGDVIVAVDGRSVNTAEELREALKQGGERVKLLVRRAGAEQELFVTPSRNTEGEREIGLWLRSDLSGIGTMTYIEPKTRQFGALGHSVNDSETGIQLPLKSGSIGKAEITRIVRGERGKPGELKGSLGLGNRIGEIKLNSSGGIFGTLSAENGTGKEAIGLAAPHCGAAELLSDVSGTLKRYQVEISRIYPETDGTRNMLLTVKDKELLALTGGIVQGMSGSPILQDGCLCGALTHVLLNDPQRGYGITIYRMLQENTEDRG